MIMGKLTHVKKRSSTPRIEWFGLFAPGSIQEQECPVEQVVLMTLMLVLILRPLEAPCRQLQRLFTTNSLRTGTNIGYR